MIFYFLPPPTGPLKRSIQRIFLFFFILGIKKWSFDIDVKIWFVLLWKLGLHVKFESCIFKIKRVMSIFRLSRWCEISILEFFWNPEILLKFWDFWLIFCMWSLNIPSKKCYIATWGQKWLLPWFLRGGLWGPPMGATESIPHGR